jgi:hypothetical protein
MGLNP